MTGASALQKSYTEKPGRTGEQHGLTRKKRSRWLLAAALAAALAVSGVAWQQNSLSHWTHPSSTVQNVQPEQTLTLTEADVDYPATAAARAALARGEIPPSLAKVDAATRSKILSGETKLYTRTRY